MISFEVKGMSCGHCVAHVRTALEAVPGIAVNEVTIGRATVACDGQPATLQAIGAALDDAGYPLAPAR